jgi:hypothetical protein
MFTKKREYTASSDRLVIRESADKNIVEVESSGKVGREDYERFMPELERLIQRMVAFVCW